MVQLTKNCNGVATANAAMLAILSGNRKPRKDVSKLHLRKESLASCRTAAGMVRWLGRSRR